MSSVNGNEGNYKRETYGSLLDNDVLDVEVLNVKVFRVRVRLSVLQKAEDELDGLLGPATFTVSSSQHKYHPLTQTVAYPELP